MNSLRLPLAGGCRCGQTRIEVTEPPLITAACHCTGCQKMASSAFSLTATFSSAAFKVTQGDPAIGGMHNPDLQHFCCPHCMSWMFTRITGFDAIVNVRPTMFDDTGWFVPFIETMTAEKLPWAQTPANHSFERFPEMEQFQELMGAFAKVD